MTEGAHRPADRLENRLEFETLIADTSALLFAASPDRLESAIECALAQVREFFGADRCALLTVSADQQVVNVRLASWGDGVPPVPPDVNLAEIFPWSRRTLLVERAPVRISRMADLPPEAADEREIWRTMPIQSALTLPIETRGNIRHLVLLNTLHRASEWPDAYVTRLRVLGELLVSALERRDTIAGLHEAEDRLSLAADSAGAGLWTLDYGTGLFWVTDRARALFGYHPGQIVNMALLESSIHPDDLGLVRKVVGLSALSSDPVEVEYRITLPDGRLRWLISRGRRRFDPDGEPRQLMGVSIDITERMEAQESLRKSESRLATGADLAGLAFYEMDFGQGVAYVDDRFRALCGLPDDQRGGLRSVEFWAEHLHPEDRERILDVRRQLHEGTIEQVSTEYRYLHPVAGQKWIQHLARVTARGDDGRATNTSGVFRDVTTRKQAETDLLELSRRLIHAHEEERALLARELHDDLSQRLAVLAIEVGRTELATAAGPQAEALRSVREGLVRLSEDVHTLAYQLHPSILEELGLVEALRAECERRSRQGRLGLTADLEPLSVAVAKDAALCLFRVAQEALSNMIRHSGTCAGAVTLRQMDDGLLLAVRDAGLGFDPANPSRSGRLGLASMRERVRLVNGTLDIESAPGRGTTVVAWVPAAGGTA